MRRPRNLRDLLVHTKPKTSKFSTGGTGLPGTYSCNASRCKTCTYTRNLQSVQYAASRDTFTVKRHFTCTSSSVVYLILCSICDAVYVGETGCLLRERFTQHRYTVCHQQDTPVPEHFSRGHTMQLSVLELAPEDALQRRLLEKKCIKRFRTSPAHNVINKDDEVDALT